MAENFNETVGALFKGMDSIITTKTVVGEAIHFDDGTILLPLVDVSFGLGAGAFQNGVKQKAGGGMGGKISPNAVLVIQDGKTKLVSIKNQDTVSRVLDAVPEVIDHFKKSPKDKAKDAEMERKGKEYLKDENK